MLKSIGHFDLSSPLTPTLRFWHKFDLPTNSLGTVQVSQNGGLSWTPVYTQSQSFATWQQVTIDLSAYKGQHITLAFFLHEVGSNQADAIPLNKTNAFSPSKQIVPFSAAAFWLVGGLGLVVANRKKRVGWSMVSLLIFLTACITYGPDPDYDYNNLDLTKGNLELVFPAGDAGYVPGGNALSPDGKWMVASHHDSNHLQGDSFVSLINLEENKVYDDVLEGNRWQWIDNEHIRINLTLIRVSDMAQWKLERSNTFEGDLGPLETADHIFAVDGFNSTYSLMTTDPNLPYVMNSNLSRSDTEAFLANRPHTIVRRSTTLGHSEPAYSPDGQYYVLAGLFEDRTIDTLVESEAVYAADGTEIGYGYKYGWSTYFLGWAYDSSGAYFFYAPRTPDGNALYRQYPTYKILVPGAASSPGTPIPATVAPASTAATETSRQSTLFATYALGLIGSLGLVVTNRKKQPLWPLTGLIIFLVACIRIGPSPDYDYNHLDLTKGNLELVFPASETGFVSGSEGMSPDGRWMAVTTLDSDQTRRLNPVSLINLEKNVIYENVVEGNRVRWLDNNHLRVGFNLIRVSDMVQWELERGDSFEGDLGPLEAADHIFAIDGFNSTYSLMTTDPDFPYVMDANMSKAETEAFLADRPHTIVKRSITLGISEPAYSPDGRYYVLAGLFEDAVFDSRVESPAVYAADGTEIGHGYKYGWFPTFLGWAYDSSGAYFRYSPRTPDGNLLYRQYPTYKILVPGAASSPGTPIPATVVPASTAGTMVNPIATGEIATQRGSQKNLAWYKLATQSGSGGWYLDDVELFLGSPPVAVADSAITAKDTVVVIPVLTNDSDADGDDLTVPAITQPGNGQATINPDNTVTYTPTTGFESTDTFFYTVQDTYNNEDTGQVTVSVMQPITIEAENYTGHIPRTGQSWLTRTTFAGYSGNGYVQTSADIGSLYATDYISNSPELQYQVAFSQTGVYAVWVYGAATNAGGDSVHIGLNGAVNPSSAAVTGFQPNQWNWSRRTMASGMATITITTPGIHTLNVWMREDGLRLDRLLIVSGEVYVPDS